MSSVSAFLVYACIFRIAIIFAGAMCVFLGYRLFHLELHSSHQQQSTISAKLAGQSLTLRNAAPGTVFSVFGIFLISMMLIQGNPELISKVNNLDKASHDSKQDQSESNHVIASSSNKEPPIAIKSLPELVRSNDQSVSEFILRGAKNEKSQFETNVEAGLAFDRTQDANHRKQAIDSYRKALDLLAIPMNQLAWDDLQDANINEALPLAQLAAQIRPQNADFLDTLAKVLAKAGRREEALKNAGEAALLDSRYQPAFDKLKNSDLQ
jgi:tetratricopeptide (TPR) repeat protein